MFCLLHEFCNGGIARRCARLFQPADVKGDGCLRHLDRADFGIELCRHLIHEFRFGSQEIPFPKRRPDREVAKTDLREQAFETMEWVCDVKDDPHGMEAMNHENEAGAEGPGPVSGMDVK